jgi:nicotinamide-nucleotide amidase
MYDREVVERIKDILISRNETLAVAESVTAGHLQAAISSATNASKFFQGGMTVYNIGQKTRQLNVEPIHAESHNCVSDRTAVQMALTINKKFLSDYGISITGYASPMPEAGVDVLFAWFCIVHKNEIAVSRKISCDKTDSVEVQINYTNQVLRALEELLRQ